MGKVKRRNSPFSPFSEKSDAEILLPPYIGEEKTGELSGNRACTDLLSDDLPLVRSNAKPGAAALVEVLKTLRAHPMVAWCERINSRAATVGGRFIRFGWPGCPDVLGQLRGGRLLGVEVKAAKGRLRPEQSAFLKRIRPAGCVALVAKDCRDVLAELGPLKKVRIE
ncbi:VRR-NUC domain-containing protein [Noviherbaspirillum humi]|uniref:VRR-NUC domain-containing protein n=1 Tax=Noviherbaspirillum humi TaxID=1688639 RepID=A0A239DNY6_9BURK|nr:VRR-NUC domain-containing protein [Noviherbaspirillum humi]SNS34216.1 VRR-NUC domain-containing protein [Noviherbaspirillum humi]